MTLCVKWIMTEFNKDRWKVVQSTADPCMYMITNTSTNKVSHMIVHTDDCDCIGDDKQDLVIIAAKFDERFKISIVDADNQLGRLRKRWTRKEDKVSGVDITQPDYIAEVYMKFSEFMNNREVHTPFPENCFLSRADEKGVPWPVDEVKAREIQERGYMKAVGCLLWAARMTTPAISCGVNMLCRMTSSPTKEAWIPVHQPGPWNPVPKRRQPEDDRVLGQQQPSGPEGLQGSTWTRPVLDERPDCLDEPEAPTCGMFELRE